MYSVTSKKLVRLSSLAVASTLALSACATPFGGDDGGEIATVDVEGVTPEEPTPETSEVQAAEQSTDSTASSPVTTAPNNDPVETSETVAPVVGADGSIIDERLDGTTVVYKRIEIQFGQMVITNQTLEGHLSGEIDPERDNNDDVLLVEVTLTNDGDGSVDIPLDLFRLGDADNLLVGVEDATDRRGDTAYSFSLDSKTSEKGWLAFPFIDGDLDTSFIEVSEGGAVPERVVLAPGATQRVSPYWVELGPQPAVSDLAINPTSGNCGWLVTAQVDRAGAGLEGVDFSNITRANSGERIIEVDVTYTYDAPTGDGSVCVSLGPTKDEVGPRLRIDGRLTTHLAVRGTDRVDPNTSKTVTYWFVVPTGDYDFEIVTQDEAAFGSWSVDFPPLPGE